MAPFKRVTQPVLPENTETSGDPKWFDLFASRVSGLAVWLHPVWATLSAWPPYNYVVAFLEHGRAFQFWSSMTPGSQTGCGMAWRSKNPEINSESLKPQTGFSKSKSKFKLEFLFLQK